MIPEYELLVPETVEEACRLKKETGGKLVAGGTDIYVAMHNGSLGAGTLIDIKGLSGLRGVIEDNGLDMGALTLHHDMEISETVRRKYQALAEGCSQVGSLQIRHRGTIGGNICNAAPSADSAGPLLVFDAQCVIEGLRGRRVIPLTEFFTGPKRTALADDELLARIILPETAPRSGSAYIKYTRRNAMDLALFGVSCYVELDGDVIRAARISLTTSAPTPMRAIRAEEVLTGNVPSEELFIKAGECAAEEAKPRSSWRSSAEFRKALATELTPRAIRTAVERARRIEA